MASLGELFIELGVFADTKELENTEKKLNKFVRISNKGISTNKNFQASLKNLSGEFLTIISAITGMGFALNKLTNDLVASNQVMLNLTRTSDISLNTFQKWDSIGKMLGVNNAAGQIANLNERLFELRLTGQGARGFQLAGINPMGQDAEGVLEQIRARIQGMDDDTAAYLLKQMGLDPQMLHLLRLGREEFEALNNEMREYRLTPKQTASIQQMNIQLKIASQKLQYLKDSAILKIMPYWTRFVQGATDIAIMFAKLGKNITDFVMKFGGLFITTGIATQKVKTLGKGLKTLLKPIRNILAIILKLTRHFPILGRSAAAFAVNLGKAFLPVIGIFAGLFLILEDLAVFLEGGDSLIGRVLNWGQEKGAEIGDAFKKMFGGDILGGLEDLGVKLLDILQDIATIITNFIGRFFGIPWEKLFPEKTSLEYSKDIDPNKQNNKTITDDMFVKPKSERQAKAQEILKKLQKIQNDKWNTAGDNMRQMHRMLTNSNIAHFLNHNNSSTHNDNRSISMPITINTNQPAQDIKRELDAAYRFTNARFAY